MPAYDVVRGVKALAGLLNHGLPRNDEEVGQRYFGTEALIPCRFHGKIEGLAAGDGC